MVNVKKNTQKIGKTGENSNDNEFDLEIDLVMPSEDNIDIDRNKNSNIKESEKRDESNLGDDSEDDGSEKLVDENTNLDFDINLEDDDGKKESDEDVKQEDLEIDVDINKDNEEQKSEDTKVDDDEKDEIVNLDEDNKDKDEDKNNVELEFSDIDKVGIESEKGEKSGKGEGEKVEEGKDKEESSNKSEDVASDSLMDVNIELAEETEMESKEKEIDDGEKNRKIGEVKSDVTENVQIKEFFEKTDEERSRNLDKYEGDVVDRKDVGADSNINNGGNINNNVNVDLGNQKLDKQYEQIGDNVKIDFDSIDEADEKISISQDNDYIQKGDSRKIQKDNEKKKEEEKQKVFSNQFNENKEVSNDVTLLKEGEVDISQVIEENNDTKEIKKKVDINSLTSGLEDRVENLESEKVKDELETKNIKQGVVTGKKFLGFKIVKYLLFFLFLVGLGVGGFFVWKTMYAGSNTIDNTSDDTSELVAANYNRNNKESGDVHKAPEKSDNIDEEDEGENTSLAEQTDNTFENNENDNIDKNNSDFGKVKEGKKEGKYNDNDNEENFNVNQENNEEDFTNGDSKVKLKNLNTEAKSLYKKLVKNKKITTKRKKIIKRYLLAVFGLTKKYLQKLEKGEDIDRSIIDKLEKYLNRAKNLMNEEGN